MSRYRFSGRLGGYICDDCMEPWARVTVLLYRHSDDQNVDDLVGANPKTTFVVLSDDQVKQKQPRLIATTETDDEGNFTFNLNDDEHQYHGEAFEVDVRIASIPGADPDAEARPVQFTITSLQPDWQEEDNLLVAPFWDYCLSARYWCHVLGLFGLWVICGRFVTCKGKYPLPGATIRAFDADWLQDDPLGQAVTDSNGHFRIYYTSAQFKKTPFSPLINVELTHGPDVYFTAEFGGNLVLEEKQADGRKPGRENVPRCFCVELCTPELVPPDADEIPHWERVEIFEVDTDFSPEGYTLPNSLVMSDCIDLHGNMPLTNVGNGKALKYRFLIGEWGWPGGVEDPAVMPSVPPAITDLTPIKTLCNSTVGYIYYTDANGDSRSAPVIIKTADLDGDGCITLLGRPVEVDMHDGTTANVAITTGNFVGAYLLMTINSHVITPPPTDILDYLSLAAAGTPVPVAQQAPIRRYRLRFQVFDFDETVDNVTNNKTLNALVIDNSPVKYALHLTELASDLCNPITGQVHILYTIDHPHLSYFNVTIHNNGGVVHNAPPLPNGTFSGNFFFRGGASGPAGFAVNVAGDPVCAYAVKLSWQTRHYHSGRGAARSTQILYCK